MSRFVMAVFDENADYVSRFLSYFRSVKDVPFELIGFTGRAAAEKYLETGPVHILLYIPEEDHQTQEEDLDWLRKRTAGGNPGELIVLSDRPDHFPDIRCIDRYRSIQAIAADLLSIYREAEQNGPSAVPRHFEEIYVLYRLNCAGGALPFLPRTAGPSALHGRILYLDLNRFSALAEPSSDRVRPTLSEVIYFFRTDPQQVGAVLHSAVQPLSECDLLTAPADMEDMDEVPAESWPELLAVLAVQGGYGAVFMDMGEAFRDLEHAFDLCRKGYLLTGPETTPGQIRSFRDYFLKRGRSDLLSRIRMVSAEKP